MYNINFNETAGSNGDKETCVFVNGVKHGPATYFWKVGHR